MIQLPHPADRLMLALQAGATAFNRRERWVRRRGWGPWPQRKACIDLF